MKEFKEIMKERTTVVAVTVLKICNKSPRTVSHYAISKQLVRSITSVGANYRAACRAKSRADFVNKLHIVEEECDESIFWLEILVALNPESRGMLLKVVNELNEILAIIVKALMTAKGIK